MMLFILVQSPKGGGLGAGFGGGPSGGSSGVQQTTDFLEKSTWALIIAIFVLSVVSNAFLTDTDNGPVDEKTKIEDVLGE